MWGEGPAKIKEVSRHEDFFSIVTEGGTGFGFKAEELGDEEPPQVGDEIEVQTTRGSTIRGVTLRGKQLFYKSEAELESDHRELVARMDTEKHERFAQRRQKLNEAYDALPIEFQCRISWFRAHNPDFRWKYEDYEMSSCTDAALIVSTLKTEAKIRRFNKASYKKQHELVPGLYDGHSGNSFDMACRLAHLYVQNPLWVILEHGAMVPLTGCDDYGCAHPRPADVMASMPVGEMAA